MHLSAYLLLAAHLVLANHVVDDIEGRILNRKAHRISTVGEDVPPAKSSLLTPSCSTEEISAFACLMDRSYPTEYVNKVLSQHLPLMEQLHNQLYRDDVEELIRKDNLTHSYRFKGNFACESDVAWVKLGWARDVTGRFLLVVNTPRFPQIVRLESCRYPEKRCEYLPPCYKSTCRQRYVNLHLIVIDHARPGVGPFVQLVPTPSACSCFVENFTYF